MMRKLTKEQAIVIFSLMQRSPIFSKQYKQACEMAISAIKARGTGHWIMPDDGLYRPICDKCGCHPWKGYAPTVEEARETFKYCPVCGVKMESEGEE